MNKSNWQEKIRFEVYNSINPICFFWIHVLSTNMPGFTDQSAGHTFTFEINQPLQYIMYNVTYQIIIYCTLRIINTYQIITYKKQKVQLNFHCFQWSSLQSHTARFTLFTDEVLYSQHFVCRIRDVSVPWPIPKTFDVRFITLNSQGKRDLHTFLTVHESHLAKASRYSRACLLSDQ